MTPSDDAGEVGDRQPSDGGALPGAAASGGGLLGLLRDEMTALRAGTAVERTVLVDSITAKVTELEAQLADVHGEIAGLRAELGGAQAAQTEAIIQAVAASLSPQLAGLGDAIAQQDVSRLAAELSYLRSALLGPAS